LGILGGGVNLDPAAGRQEDDLLEPRAHGDSREHLGEVRMKDGDPLAARERRRQVVDSDYEEIIRAHEHVQRNAFA
jgi:hypothetical protein